MTIAQDLAMTFKNSMKIFPETSRLEVGGTEFAFHCDKFNTRIIKNLEDVLGVEEGGELLCSSAESSTFTFLQNFLNNADVRKSFDAADASEKMQTILNIFMVLAYGKIDVVELSEKSSTFTSTSTYLSEGWIENQKRWRWLDREDPVCHDFRGYLAAALSVVYNKPVGSYRVVETLCRAKHDSICEFKVEVI